LLNDTDKNITTWPDNMKNAFKFVSHAEKKLKTGSPEERK